jgi:hypothetical protein
MKRINPYISRAKCQARGAACVEAYINTAEHSELSLRWHLAARRVNNSEINVIFTDYILQLEKFFFYSCNLLFLIKLQDNFAIVYEICGLEEKPAGVSYAVDFRF